MVVPSLLIMPVAKSLFIINDPCRLPIPSSLCSGLKGRQQRVVSGYMPSILITRPSHPLNSCPILPPSNNPS
eukprot:5932390-Ditylum_brightwellii.AAC.1